MTVIDTCVLSSLAKIDRLDLLRKSFENIILTPSVVNEIEEVGEAKFVKRIKEAINEEVEHVYDLLLSKEEIEDFGVKALDFSFSTNLWWKGSIHR